MKMLRMLLIMFLLCLPVYAAENIILDTDLASDCDDVGAVSTLRALADNGEANILAVISTANAFKSPHAVQASMGFYGYDVPVGNYPGNDFGPAGGTFDIYATDIADTWDNGFTNGDPIPLGWVVYRQVLAAQPDASVKIVTIGKLRNLKLLYDSPGDSHSPLTGAELIAAKVTGIYIQGGGNPVGDGGANLRNDPTGAQVINQLGGTNVVFSQLGSDVITHATLGGPLWKSYNLFTTLHPTNGHNNRPSWDQIVVLYAVRGLESNFSLSSDGTNTVTGNGSNSFSYDGGNHNLLQLATTTSSLKATIETLMNQAVGAGTPPPPPPPPSNDTCYTCVNPTLTTCPV